ncbi:MAG: LbtU family siderophore porin [Phycisphaerae bacterium]|jgi:hypothetical protein|nr:LbtU family siderophore porin [Phycisphaerae bacterium]
MNPFQHQRRLTLAIGLALAAPAAFAQNADNDPNYPQVTLSGEVEVEAFHSSPFAGSDESDIALATAFLGLEGVITDQIRAEISTLFEEDDTPLEVDTASVMLGAEDDLWSLRAGQFYLPFGVFETAMISDPLTLELGETRETAVQAGIGTGGFNAAVFAFNGDLESESEVNGFGATAGYQATLGATDLTLSAGYLNSLGDSDVLQDTITAATGGADTDEVGAWTASAVVGVGDVTLVGEYLAATEDFAPGEVGFRGNGAKPAAWNLEAGYGFEMMGRPATAAVGYQGTDEALALEYPESRLLAAFSVEILPYTALSFEYAHDEDYDTNDGGSGETADTFTAQLAVAF